MSVLRLLPRIVTWAFALASLAVVGWLLVQTWRDPTGTSQVLGVGDGDRTWRAWGLTYRGTAGLLLGGAQLVAVVAALGMTLARRAPWRRAGAALLLAWTLLWSLNALWAWIAFRVPRLGVPGAMEAMVIVPVAAAAAFAVQTWRSSSRAQQCRGDGRSRHGRHDTARARAT